MGWANIAWALASALLKGAVSGGASLFIKQLFGAQPPDWSNINSEIADIVGEELAQSEVADNQAAFGGMIDFLAIDYHNAVAAKTDDATLLTMLENEMTRLSLDTRLSRLAESDLRVPGFSAYVIGAGVAITCYQEKARLSYPHYTVANWRANPKQYPVAEDVVAYAAKYAEHIYGTLAAVVDARVGRVTGVDLQYLNEGNNQYYRWYDVQAYFADDVTKAVHYGTKYHYDSSQPDTKDADAEARSNGAAVRASYINELVGQASWAVDAAKTAAGFLGLAADPLGTEAHPPYPIADSDHVTLQALYPSWYLNRTNDQQEGGNVLRIELLGAPPTADHYRFGIAHQSPPSGATARSAILDSTGKYWARTITQQVVGRDPFDGQVTPPAYNLFDIEVLAGDLVEIRQVETGKCCSWVYTGVDEHLLFAEELGGRGLCSVWRFQKA